MFLTDRLLVKEWHSLAGEEWEGGELALVVERILTERVTRGLPAAWQGAFSAERAREWIRERDDEGTTLLIVERATGRAIGFVILFEEGTEVRLGYLLAESAWGKGLATEVVGGLVAWCRGEGIGSLAGGVERGNVASARVLQKCGFEEVEGSGEEQLFRLYL